MARPSRRKERESTKSLIDKLGVKSDSTVVVLRVEDDNFRKVVQERTPNTSTRLSRERDLIFYKAKTREGLRRIGSLQDYINKNGAIWVVTPKGTDQVKQTDVIVAAKQAGLLDVKVVSFSETHTASNWQFRSPVAKSPIN